MNVAQSTYITSDVSHGTLVIISPVQMYYIQYRGIQMRLVSILIPDP